MAEKSSSLECGIKQHQYNHDVYGDNLLVNTSELHSVLRNALQENFASYICDDLELFEAMDQMDEGHDHLFNILPDEVSPDIASQDIALPDSVSPDLVSPEADLPSGSSVSTGISSDFTPQQAMTSRHASSQFISRLNFSSIR